MDLTSLRQTASHILAASVFELYPSIDLWSAEATDSGFVCEFYFPHPLNSETLPLIEGQMKQIVRENRPIRTLEMVPLSAFELLKAEGHETQCQILDEIEGNLVELIEIGDFHQLSEGPLLKNTAELAAFKLLSLEPLSDRGVRITGVASFSKGDLKEFLKKLSAYQEMDYRTTGQGFGFWRSFEEGLIWTERGIQARLQVINLFFQEAPLVDYSGDPELLINSLWQDCRRIVLDSTKDLHASQFSVQKTTFCSHTEILERITSSLHSNYKILIMLGFDCWVRISGKRRDWKDLRIDEGIRVERVEGDEPGIEFMVEDPILRPWAIASLKKLKLSTENTAAFVCEAFVERIMVLLLEKNLGIPLFLERART